MQIQEITLPLRIIIQTSLFVKLQTNARPGLGVGFTFAPLHISNPYLSPRQPEPNPHRNCCQTPDIGLGQGVDFTFSWDNNNKKLGLSCAKLSTA